MRGNINFSWNLLDNLTLATRLTVTAGQSNTRMDTELNVTNDITETIALKLSYDSKYHTKVPSPTLSKRDSIFTVNLLFAF